MILYHSDLPVNVSPPHFPTGPFTQTSFPYTLPPASLMVSKDSAHELFCPVTPIACTLTLTFATVRGKQYLQFGRREGKENFRLRDFLGRPF